MDGDTRYCPLIGKQRFRTRSDALLAAQSMKNRGCGTPSVYWCEECNSYHLTHYTYQHCKETAQFFDDQKKRTRRHKQSRDMKIIIDNAYVTDGAMVSIKQLADGGEHLHLALFDVDDKSLSVDFTYLQALELIEALKLQIGKMKPNINN